MPLFGLSKSDVEKMEAKRDVEGLIKALTYKKDADVRYAAAVALGGIGDARAVDALIATLKDDQNSNVCREAAEALGKIDDPRAAEALRELEKKIKVSSYQRFHTGEYQPPTVLGKPVIDLRSGEEQATASRARSTLEVEDEEIAQKLAQLSRLSDIQYATDKAAYEETVAEFRRIGEQLCANGGDKRMRRVAYRVQALGGRSRDCEMYWEGVCGWMA